MLWCWLTCSTFGVVAPLELFRVSFISALSLGCRPRLDIPTQAVALLGIFTLWNLGIDKFLASV